MEKNKNIKRTKIKSINLIPNEDVYDIKVSDNHNFFANNLLVHNCGEIFMGQYDSCRLIAYNIFNCVENPFTDKAKFNYKKWYSVCYDGQRLGDDLVEIELEHVNRIISKIESDKESDEVKQHEIDLWKKIKQTGKNGRRTGSGITALGDALAALGLKYDDDNSLKTIEKIMKTKFEAELDSTTDLAIERGHFKGFNSASELNESENEKTIFNFIKNNFKEQWNKMQNFGRRNVSWSTVAPTGSLSILTQTTSGIEPLFMMYYKRRKKINPNDIDAKVDFIDQMGDRWQEFNVIHPKILVWLNSLGLEYYPKKYIGILPKDLPKEVLDNILSKSPWNGATSPEIDWIKRVEIQSIIQKYTTHSISSTINLPNDVTEEKVSEIYIESWKKGLKGITVYRDGCRSGVLINDDSSKKDDKLKIQKTESPRRPKTLNVDIHHVTAEGKKWIVIVGLLENDPYEVFSFKPKSIHIPTKVKTGTLTKIKRGRYDLELDGGFIIEDIRNNFESDEQSAISRMISTALRHGADINFIYEQLNKAEGNITSFSKAIGRALKKYIKDQKLEGEKCENCGESTMILQEGCKICSSCGNSRC